MSFTDIFKRNFLESVNSLSATEIIVTLALCFVLSLYIFFMYKVCSRSVMYSRNFNVTMAAMTIVSATVVMAIRGDVVLSLGMVGALSIVRFRTAIKDPIDLLFLFWAITTGIVMGSGKYMLALIGCFATAIVLLVMTLLPMGGTAYLLVFGCRDDEALEAARKLVRENVKRSVLKSKSVSGSGIEMTYEVSVRDTEGKFVTALNGLDGVTHAALVSYDGEYIA